jgi:predicted molibdopterin-dependent oxidoreductase YjgC
MSDSNSLFLKTASDLMNDLNIRYMEADFDTQVELRDQLDRAMTAYSEAELTILRKSVKCTPEDVAQMQKLRQQVAKSANFTQLLSTVGSVASFFVKRFLL